MLSIQLSVQVSILLIAALPYLFILYPSAIGM